MCFGRKSNNTTTTINKGKQTNPGQSRENIPGHLAPQSDASPIGHRDN